MASDERCPDLDVGPHRAEHLGETLVLGLLGEDGERAQERETSADVIVAIWRDAIARSLSLTFFSKPGMVISIWSPVPAGASVMSMGVHAQCASFVTTAPTGSRHRCDP